MTKSADRRNAPSGNPQEAPNQCNPYNALGQAELQRRLGILNETLRASGPNSPEKEAARVTRLLIKAAMARFESPTKQEGEVKPSTNPPTPEARRVEQHGNTIRVGNRDYRDGETVFTVREDPKDKATDPIFSIIARQDQRTRRFFFIVECTNPDVARGAYARSPLNHQRFEDSEFGEAVRECRAEIDRLRTTTDPYANIRHGNSQRIISLKRGSNALFSVLAHRPVPHTKTQFKLGDPTPEMEKIFQQFDELRTQWAEISAPTYASPEAAFDACRPFLAAIESAKIQAETRRRAQRNPGSPHPRAFRAFDRI